MGTKSAALMLFKIYCRLSLSIQYTVSLAVHCEYLDIEKSAFFTYIGYFTDVMGTHFCCVTEI